MKIAHANRDGLTQDALRMTLRNEGLIAARLGRCRLLTADPDGIHLVLTLIRGRPLSARFRDRQPQVWWALRIGAFPAQALEILHQAGILHLDVKPANVLLGSSWRFAPALIDFGSARLISGPHAAGLSSTAVPGTLRYRFRAPEQLLGDTRLPGLHSDSFGLGATMFWLLAGRPPFKNGVRDMPSMRRHHEQELAIGLAECAVVGVPDAVIDLLACLLAFEPNRRPRTLRSVADNLFVHSTRSWMHAQDASLTRQIVRSAAVAAPGTSRPESAPACPVPDTDTGPLSQPRTLADLLPPRSKSHADPSLILLHNRRSQRPRVKSSRTRARRPVPAGSVGRVRERCIPAVHAASGCRHCRCTAGRSGTGPWSTRS